MQVKIMNRDNNPLICFVVILGASLRGIWGEYLSFRWMMKTSLPCTPRQTGFYHNKLKNFELAHQSPNKTLYSLWSVKQCLAKNN